MRQIVIEQMSQVKRMKKFLCIISIALMTLNINVVNVFATEREECKNDICEEDYNYINYALNYIGYEEGDAVYYTELYETCDEDNNKKYVSFIYDDEKAIGQYIKTESEEDEHSCFVINAQPNVFNSVINCYNGNEFDITDEDILEEAAVDGAQNEGWERISATNAKYVTGSAASGHFIQAPIIGNTNNPNTNKGLCWAACGASVANYYLGTSYSALSMCAFVRNVTHEEPVGSPEFQIAMYDALGFDYDYIERRLTYSQALTALENGSLIKYKMVSTVGSHSVILCGVFRISTSYGFIYMDPNISGAYVLNCNDASVAKTTSGKFYYYNGQVLFTSVESTFFNFK